MKNPVPITAAKQRHAMNSNRAVLRRQLSTGSRIALLALICCNNIASGQYRPTTLPKGYVQIEGDIITTETKAAILLGQGPRPSFTYAPERLWPNRTVPYEFDPGVNSSQRAVFQAAMAAWQNSYPGVTTIRFQPRNGEVGYLRFVVGNPGFIGGVADFVGYYEDGPVTITVHSNAVSTFLICHEIGHALGLWHEQSRTDRDAYVTVLTNNIASGFSGQFRITSDQSTFGDYDYDSIMHYFACAFSVCTNCNCATGLCTTLQTAYAAQQCRIGQQDHLSNMDRRTMAFMYGPPNWKFLYPNYQVGINGSFQHPYVTLPMAIDNAPTNSTVWIGPGAYPTGTNRFRISKPLTLRAALADLQLQADGSLGPSPSGYARLRNGF